MSGVYDPFLVIPKALRAVPEGPGGRPQTVGFTNGCFDGLHVGHVLFLREAAQMVDLLVVGLDADEDVRRRKGEGRPLWPWVDRTIVLQALRAVFGVIRIWDGPAAALEAIRPDVLFRGEDQDPAEGAGFAGRVEVVRRQHPARSSWLVRA